MIKAHTALLALLNFLAAAITAGVCTQFGWKEWWYPLIVVGAACSIVSSFYLQFLESKAMEGSPERTLLRWVGYGLTAVGVGLGFLIWQLSK